MFLTLLWKWLRSLSRPDGEMAAPPVLGGVEPGFVNRSTDINNTKPVIFEGKSLR